MWYNDCSTVVSRSMIIACLCSICTHYIVHGVRIIVSIVNVSCAVKITYNSIFCSQSSCKGHGGHMRPAHHCRCRHHSHEYHDRSMMSYVVSWCIVVGTSWYLFLVVLVCCYFPVCPISGCHISVCMSSQFVHYQCLIHCGLYSAAGTLRPTRCGRYSYEELTIVDFSAKLTFTNCLESSEWHE